MARKFTVVTAGNIVVTAPRLGMIASAARGTAFYPSPEARRMVEGRLKVYCSMFTAGIILGLGAILWL